MAWPNPFRHKDENTRNVWGYTFQWTPNHFSEEQLHPLKHTYDVLGEECLNRLDEISPPISSELPRNQPRTSKEPDATLPKRDLYALLRDHRHGEGNEKLLELWNEITDLPDWVDWDQIARGQEVFYRYAGVALTAVLMLSTVTVIRTYY